MVLEAERRRAPTLEDFFRRPIRKSWVENANNDHDDVVHVGQAYAVMLVKQGLEIPEDLQLVVLGYANNERKEYGKLKGFFGEWNGLHNAQRENVLTRNKRSANLRGLLVDTSYTRSWKVYLRRMDQAYEEMKQWFPQAQKVVGRLSDNSSVGKEEGVKK